MRKIIILILFVLLSLPCFAQDVLYLNKTWDRIASKIMYEHELRELNVTLEKAYEIFGFKQSDVRAVFYDLNSDGVNEIIGYVNAGYSRSSDGLVLKILKKVNGRYENISMVNTAPAMVIHILNTKTSGFYDLKVYPTKMYISRVAKYNPKYQYYEYFFSN